jgi:hypothetical protein
VPLRFQSNDGFDSLLPSHHSQLVVHPYNAGKVANLVLNIAFLGIGGHSAPEDDAAIDRVDFNIVVEGWLRGWRWGIGLIFISSPFVRFNLKAGVCLAIRDLPRFCHPPADYPGSRLVGG